MKGKLLCALGIFAVLALLTPQDASACGRCKIAGIVCNGFDECSIVEICAPGSFGQVTTTDCYVDWWGCHASGEFCSWASKAIPAQNEQAPDHETQS